MSIVELKQILSSLFRKPKETVPIVILLIIIVFCGFWANGYFGKKGEQAAQIEQEIPAASTERPPSKDDNSSPSADEIKITGGMAAPWYNEYGGYRPAYQRLLQWRDTIHNSIRKDWINAEIERVEKSYPVDVMRINMDNPNIWGYICVPHVGCSQGYEKSIGFSAGNVISHLTRDLWMERARAACILRNIKTAPDKDSVNKEDFYKKIINLMSKKENSLSVSKMALETYGDLTGFRPNGVFDFEGAVKDWEKRKDEILKINF